MKILPIGASRAGRIGSPKIIATLLATPAALLLFAQADPVTNTPTVATHRVLERRPGTGLKIRASQLSAPGNRPTLRSVSAQSASGGSVVKRGDWIFYQPRPGVTDADSFTYELEDDRGVRTEGLVSITVKTEKPDAPQNLTFLEVLPNGDCRVRFLGIPGRSYTIQYNSNPETPDWRPLGECLADSTGQLEWTDTTARGQATRNYRSINP